MTTTFVLGATGKTGARLVDVLRTSGRAVRIGSRRADPAFDWDDDRTWTPVLDRVKRVYLAYYPDVSFPAGAEWTILRSASFAQKVERVLGRRPRDFAEYARDTAVTGVWAQRARA